MDAAFSSADWSLIPSFLAVAETGSLSAAARKLNRSQPSLGRDIKQLEDQLGLSLFDRHARGLSLSETGADLLPMARQMREAMQALTTQAAGQAQNIGGTVRITASVYASHFILPPILAKIRTELPDIQLDLVPTDSSENLLFRESDIAVRMYRPTQMEIVTRHVATLKMAAYASKNI